MFGCNLEEIEIDDIIKNIDTQAKSVIENNGLDISFTFTPTDENKMAEELIKLLEEWIQVTFTFSL
jgi:hypothetical protein